MITRHWIPALIWLAVITGLSVTPNMQLPSVKFFAPDKLGHAGAYALLSWLALRAWARERGAASAQSAAWITGAAAAYGVLMEFVQYAFVPGRYYEYGDMLANAVGAALGYLFFSLFRRPRG